MKHLALCPVTLSASVLLTLCLPFGSSVHAEVTPPSAMNCQTTREFVTTLEFVRADEDFQMKERESEARDIAFKVAEGCTGSAKRFIRVAKALTRAGANRKNATEVALKFAQGSDAETDAFNSVFRKAIAEDSLDLDFESSVKIALSLSKEFKGDLARVREDFERVVDYCSDASRLGLSRVTCGEFAAGIARAGEKWNGGVSKPFIQSFEYLTSSKGPGLTTRDALKIAESLAKQGPGAPENFMQAYQYATSTSGLNQPRAEAIAFARKMAAITEAAVKNEEKAANPEQKPNHSAR